MTMKRLVRTGLYICIFLMMIMPSSLNAAEEGTETPQVAGKPADFQYPFIAEVTGNDVYIRSGKGTAYYQCGKLNAGYQITVVDEVFGWAKVVPPDGSYSWINKNYVKIDPPGSNKGVVTGENVRVWAGSDYIEPMRSSSMQVKLNKNKDEIDEEDDFVELFPDQPEEGDYYKIKPPVGAYLWISAEFLKYTSPKAVVVPPRPEVPKETAPEVLPAAPEEKKPDFKPLDVQPQETTKPDVPAETPAVTTPETPAEISAPAEPVKNENPETAALKRCYEIAAALEEELKKPIKDQSYTEYKKELKKINEDKNTGNATAYAKILLDRIAGYELAISVSDIVNQQDKQLSKTKSQIENAHQAQLEKIPEEVNYMYSGTLKTSHVYTAESGERRYLLMDPNGKIICYVVAGSPTIAADLEKMVNSKIGITGEHVSDAKSLVALISVTGAAKIP